MCTNSIELLFIRYFHWLFLHSLAIILTIGYLVHLNLATLLYIANIEI